MFCMFNLPNVSHQVPITRSLQLPHISVTAFSQTDLFFYLEFRSPHEPQWPIAITSTDSCSRVDMIGQHVHVRPHCFILTEACSCRLELTYFVGKISKIRLVCKNAIALAYYGSCRILVMDSWSHLFHFKGSAPIRWPHPSKRICR